MITTVGVVVAVAATLEAGAAIAIPTTVVVTTVEVEGDITIIVDATRIIGVGDDSIIVQVRRLSRQLL